MAAVVEGLSEDELDRLRWLVCTRKVALGQRAAMRLAAQLRRDGEQMAPYRCPFADDAEGHWHIGHPPSMRTLRQLARFLRARHAGSLLDP